MKLSGKQLAQAIALAGLEGMSRSEVVKEFAERGIAVAPGSVGRALSRARGTWEGGDSPTNLLKSSNESIVRYTGTTLDGKELPDPRRQYLVNGEVVGGLDLQTQLNSILDSKTGGKGFAATVEHLLGTANDQLQNGDPKNFTRQGFWGIVESLYFSGISDHDDGLATGKAEEIINEYAFQLGQLDGVPEVEELYREVGTLSLEEAFALI